MKKINALVLIIMFFSCISCGGGGGSGGGDSGTYVIQAKQIAASGAHAAIAAMMVSVQGAFDALKELPPQNERHDFSTYYSSDYGGGGPTGDDLMTGSYAYSYTQTLSRYNLTFPQNNPVMATSTLVELQSPIFTLPNSSDTHSTTMSTATGNLLANHTYGTASFTMDDHGDPSFSAIDVHGSDISVTNMVVTLADASTGTISFSSQQASVSLGSSGTSTISEVTEMVSTVVYGGETYTCTISAEREATFGEPTAFFNISSATCHI
jgi:hypothetical protein